MSLQQTGNVLSIRPQRIEAEEVQQAGIIPAEEAAAVGATAVTGITEETQSGTAGSGWNESQPTKPETGWSDLGDPQKRLAAAIGRTGTHAAEANRRTLQRQNAAAVRYGRMPYSRVKAMRGAYPKGFRSNG